MILPKGDKDMENVKIGILGLGAISGIYLKT